jgi:hypothetical protein
LVSELEFVCIFQAEEKEEKSVEDSVGLFAGRQQSIDSGGL